MSINIYKPLILTMCLMISFTAFGSEKHPHVSKQTAKGKFEHSHPKPGARIEFTHNYDGSTSQGETENLRLSFIEAYEAGSLTVKLEPQEGLSISGSVSTYFSMENDEHKLIDLVLTAEGEGRPRLNIFVEAMLPEGEIERRVFAVAININSDQQSTSQLKDVTTKSSQLKAHATSSRSSTTQSVIVLPAQEFIGNTAN